MKLVALLLWALCLHQGSSLPISPRAPLTAQQSGSQVRRNPAFVRKVRNSAETFDNSRERPDLTDNARKRSSVPDEATEMSSPTRGDMSVLENEVSVVSREMDTTEAGQGKGVAPGPRYEVVTDSVDTTDSEKDVADPSVTPEIPSVDSVDRDTDTTTTGLKETGVHEVALERKGIAEPDVSDTKVESTGETAPGIPDVDKATIGLKRPVSEVATTTETPKTETKEPEEDAETPAVVELANVPTTALAAEAEPSVTGGTLEPTPATGVSVQTTKDEVDEATDSAAEVTGTDDLETVDVDEESDSAPADEAKSDLEGVGTKVTSPARPDEDWKLPTTEVDDDHASTEAAEGGPTDDGDKASTPDIEDWVEMEISVASHDEDNDHYKTTETSAGNSEGEYDLQTSPTSRPDQVLVPSTDPVKIDLLGGSAQLDSQEQSSIFRLLGSLSSALKGGQALSDRFPFRFSSGMSKLSDSPVADRSLEHDAAPASRFPFTTGSQAVEPFGQSRGLLGHSVFADVQANPASRQRSPGRAGLESLLSLFGFSLPGAVTDQVAKNPYPRVFGGYKQADRLDGSRSVDTALPNPPPNVFVHVHINCPGKTTEPAENIDRSSPFFPNIDGGVASFPKLLPMLMPGSSGTRPRSSVADPDSESRSISSFLSGSARPSNTLSTADSFGVFHGHPETSDMSGKTAAEEQSSPRIALVSPATVYI